jgi:glutathione-independent formaldehyde dehydrogenase
LAAAASARLLGAAVVIIGDVNPIRLAHAKAQGFEIADLAFLHTLGRMLSVKVC